ncbi:MAG TPA: aminotransferase class III-fold pyridoxal phosphate-dependent enzyme [Thermoleophilaceae bacterium]|nr:aminotransferase class III-fold pyridoxal phosphate-dependent enzyme [Thermoleophilaceae bacterium]
MSATEAALVDATALADVYRAHVNATHAITNSVMTGHAEVRAEGCLIFDESGQDYLDCGGNGVFLLGHRHPDVVAAVQAQIESQPMQGRFLLNPVIARAAEALARVTPDGLEYVFLHCSGAEAVEMAIKLARLAGRPRLVATEGGFHGKSNGALSLTGRAKYRDPFAPLLEGVTHVPYGDADAIAAVLAAAPGECAVFVEPVQGEGGVRIPPPGYLRAVEGLCREHGALLVLDEIQTGLGRLGMWWGAEIDAVRPDVLLSGKILGGGVLPVSAVVATPEVYARLNRDPYLHSSTFANSPVMAAAAAATVEVLEGSGVIEATAAIGDSLLERLRDVVAERGEGLVADVRGLGLLIGLEFTTAGIAGEFLFELIGEHRVLPSYSLNEDATLRLTPSALISDEQQERLIGAVAMTLDAVRGRTDAPAR